MQAYPTQVTSSKFLFVLLDQHLSWKDHMKAISSKIAKNVGILQRSSYLLPSHVRLTLYFPLIYPYFTYRRVGIILPYLHFWKFREKRGLSFGRIGLKNKNSYAIKREFLYKSTQMS